MVLRVDNLSHLQWANRVIEWEGKDANLEEIYNMSVQELADRFHARADAESEDDDESVSDESEVEAEGNACKKAYKELVKEKKKKAAKKDAPKKKPVKRAASDSDSDEDEDEDETELEKPPKKKPGRKSHNKNVWEKFLFVDRTSMSAPLYGSYVETMNWDFKKPVKFKAPNGGWVFKRLDWGQFEPVKYFWKKLDDTDIEEHY